MAIIGSKGVSMFSLLGELPRHQYCFVDSSFTHRVPVGFVPATWYGLVSMRGRTWGLTVMLESGAVYRNLPPHAIAFDRDPPPWDIKDAQRWDVYGTDFTAIEYTYLQNLVVMAHVNDGSASRSLLGTYLFTVGPIGDGFSAFPEQAKEFSFVRLDNGRLTIQPTNHLIFRERSFTKNDAMAFPLKDLKRQFEVFSCERLPEMNDRAAASDSLCSACHAQVTQPTSS
jgi:hypothetical protein